MELGKPVIAAIQGYCIGSGLEIALLSDLRIAASGAIFAMPEVQLGMIPAAGGTRTLPRAVGPAAALDLILTGRRIDAAEALRLGLVTRVVPEERLWEAAWEVARQLAGASPRSRSGASLDSGLVAAVKAALWQGPDLSLEAALQLETRLAALALGFMGRAESRPRG
jgi:enoyl-CoA hydratase